MKHSRSLSILLGVYVLALIANAPAVLLDSAVCTASDGRLRIAEAHGTIWSGNGLLEIRDRSSTNVGYKTGIAKSIEWHVIPTSLLHGHLVCDIGLDQSTTHFLVAATLFSIEVTNVDIHLPAAALSVGIPALAPLGLSGDVLVHVAQLTLTPHTMRGSVVLQWRDANAAQSPVSPLGDYELHLDGKGTEVVTTLSTHHKSALQLDGQGTWTIGNKPVFLTTARIQPQFQLQLAPYLRLIAVERGDGSFALQFN